MLRPKRIQWWRKTGSIYIYLCQRRPFPLDASHLSEIYCCLLLSATLNKISVSLVIRPVRVGSTHLVDAGSRTAALVSHIRGTARRCSSFSAKKTRLRRFRVSYLVCSSTCSPNQRSSGTPLVVVSPQVREKKKGTRALPPSLTSRVNQVKYFPSCKR